MTETVNRPESDVRLREWIDAMATRLVLDGAGCDMATDLARLSEMAAGGGCPETARIAAELAERTCAGGEPAVIEVALRDGLAQLAQVLEHEARQAASPTEESGQGAPDPELVGDFIMESREHLASIESRMLDLEHNPGDLDAIHSVFRGFHTIKGLAGFLEFADIQEMAHEVETLLDLARNSKLAITPAVVDVVLASADYLKQAIVGVEVALRGSVSPPAGNHLGLLSRIRTVMSGDSRREAAPAETQPASVAETPAPAPPLAGAPAKEPMAVKAGDTLSVRVETGKLDYLMDMVGEMVIAQSLIRHNPSLAAVPDSRLQRDLSQLARITSEVQRTAMGMRMVPIGQLFQRTARLVRDLLRKAGKQVELETSGEDTELDKTIAEELADPLMHMVRNAIDHGVEPPEDGQRRARVPRRACGWRPTTRAGRL